MRLFLPFKKKASVLLVTLIATIVFVLPQAAHAQQLTPSVTPSAATVERQQDEFARIQLVSMFFRETLSALTCQLIGVERTTPYQDCLTVDQTTHALRPLTQQEVEHLHLKRGGALVFSSNAIGYLFTKPTDTASYLRYLSGNFGLSKKAYAQPVTEVNPGTGFQSLTQIESLFILMRNIVFLLLVIIFIVVGFLIMIRFHLDPRTVMTIQNQIPKAIIAILLITFSYAIAGALIDAMWVVTYFGINTVASTKGSCDATGTQPHGELPLQSVATIGILNNPFSFTTDIFGDRTGCFGAFDGISGLSWNVGSSFSDLISRSVLAGLGVNEISSKDCSLDHWDICVRLALFEIVKFILTILAFLIVFIAILASLARLWFTLLKTYIMVIIEIIIGPFVILLGLIPGTNFGFSRWVRGIIAQLAVFPTAAILLVMASVIAQDPNINTVRSNAFIPPLIGNPNISGGIGSIMAFGFILITPNILEMLREAFQAPESKHAGLVTAGLGAAAGRLISAGRGTTQQLTERHSAEAMYDPSNPHAPKYRQKGIGIGPVRVRG